MTNVEEQDRSDYISIYIFSERRKDMAIDNAITLIPIITVLIVLYSLAWHNQPAKHPVKEPARPKQAPPKQRKQV